MQSKSIRRRSEWVRFVVSVLLGTFWLFTAGCSREPAPAFQVSEAGNELATGHRDQILSQLDEYFGTPLHPRRSVVEVNPDSGTSTVAENKELTDVLAHGAQVFQRRCAGCHGATGAGDGPAAEFLQPKPRDYRPGIFKFTSTPVGAKPTREDLHQVIRKGAKGTSMPSFPFLMKEDVDAVIEYVILLSIRGEVERTVTSIVLDDYDEGDEIDKGEFIESLAGVDMSWTSAAEQAVHPISKQPPYSDESILAGRLAFLASGCSKCHGDDVKGQTEWLSDAFLAEQENADPENSIQVNLDSWGNVAPAADLTAGMLHGGRRPVDIYRRIYTGINGTPMPAFEHVFKEDPDKFWHIVHYVLSVVDKREVEGLADVVAPAVPVSE